MEKDDFERRSEKYVEDGLRNVKNAELIENWCSHIQVTRSAGRGMLEEMTGVPIGHMGVDCQHSSGGSMQSWDIRSSFVSFYEQNCSTCTFRSVKNIPNAQPIIDEHISRKRTNEEARRTAEDKSNQELKERKKTRQTLLNDDPNVIAILNALDHLDVGTENTKGVPPEEELIELAKLAPEVWGDEILGHLVETSLSDSPYKLKKTCATLLLILPASKEQKARSCFANLGVGASNKLARWASKNIALATKQEIENALLGAVYRASRSYGIGMHNRRSNNDLLVAIANRSPDYVKSFLKNCYDDGKGTSATTAARAITALSEPFPDIIKDYMRDTCSWYLRWRSRDESLYELKDSEVTHLRDATAAMFKAFPEETDKYLQDLMIGLTASRKADVDRIYQHVIRGKGFDDTEFPSVIKYEKIAFKRLLWRAVEVVELEDFELKRASDYFSKPEYINPEFATEMQDTLLGAATALGGKREKIEAKPLIETLDPFSEMTKVHIIRSVTNLREGLIGLVFRAALKNEDDFNSIVKFFNDIPETDSELQAAFVSQLHRLAPNANKLNQVLPIYYNALYSEHALVRYSASHSIWELKYSLVRDLPPLMFETLLLQLVDTYVIVHKSAIRDMKTYLIPNDFRALLKRYLIGLFAYYLKENESPDFVQELCEKLLPMLTEEEINGGYGGAMLRYAKQQSDMNRAKFAEDFTFTLRHIPGVVSFHINQIRSDWSLQVNSERLVDLLLRIEGELLEPHRKKLLEVAKAECGEKVREVYKWVRIFTTKGMFDEAKELATETLASVPEEKRNQKLRAWLSLLKSACDFESEVHNKSTPKKEIELWNKAHHNYTTLETDKHERRIPYFF